MEINFTREEALALLKKYNKEPFHIQHALTVEGVLRWYAKELGLPVENIVYAHQQDYYNAINKSTEDAQCSSFIEFMLEKILETLKSHQGSELSKTDTSLTERQQKILQLLNENVALNVATNVALNSNDLAEKLGVSRKTIERDMTVLQEKGLVQRVGSNKTGHWELVKKDVR